MAHDTRHYTVNKGKLLFQKTGELGWEDLGNASKVEIAEEIETLEHYSSRSSFKNRDQLLVVSLKATGSFTLDEISVKNLQKYFLAGDVTTTNQAANPTGIKTFLPADKITPDKWFKIGEINILVTQVDDDETPPVIYTEGTDYELDLKSGMIFILEGGAIAADQKLKVTYTSVASTITAFKGGEITSLVGKLLFVADPAIGEIADLEGYGTVTPEGSYTAISDEYVSLDMKLEYLTHNDYKPGLFKIENRGNKAD